MTTAEYLEITTIEPETISLSASFEITDWDQEYYESWDEWSDYVEIYYEVENTGDAEIDYYTVYFTVTCRVGREYYDWHNGSGVAVGKKLSGTTMINVGGKEARSVEITDWELEHY